MPSRTLTPDPPAAPGQPTPPEPPASGQHAPPEPPAPGQHAPPASSRLRLITVPAGWPPYDCETHGAACPVAREAAITSPHVSRQEPASAGPPGPTAPLPAPGQDRTRDAPSGQATALPRRFARVEVELLAG